LSNAKFFIPAETAEKHD